MNSRLREAIARQMERSRSDYVFVKGDRVSPYRSIRTAFATACRSASIDGVTSHTLRHTFASRLAMAGYSDRLIQELGAWKDSTMVARYAHLSPDHKAEAVEKILEIPRRF